MGNTCNDTGSTIYHLKIWNAMMSEDYNDVGRYRLREPLDYPFTHVKHHYRL
jgi:hypothetical protein